MQDANRGVIVLHWRVIKYLHSGNLQCVSQEKMIINFLHVTTHAHPLLMCYPVSIAKSSPLMETLRGGPMPPPPSANSHSAVPSYCCAHLWDRKCPRKLLRNFYFYATLCRNTRYVLG